MENKTPMFVLFPILLSEALISNTPEYDFSPPSFRISLNAQLQAVTTNT